MPIRNRVNCDPGPFRRPTGQLFEIGDSVEVAGLESEGGRQLNGRVGVVTAWKPETGRFDVLFGSDKEVALKPSNLKKPKLVVGDCVEVSGLESDNGKALNGQQGHILSFSVEDGGSFQVCLEKERRLNLKPENVERPPLGVGDSVEVCGLESESGKQLNGQKGVIVQQAEETGRFKVGFHDPEKVVSLKPENLSRPPLGPGDTVLVVGLESESGRLLNGQKGLAAKQAEESGRWEVEFKVVRLTAESLKKIDLALNPGDAVEVHGLAPESGGKALNGQKGGITMYLKDTGLYQVKFGPTKMMSLKAENLRKFGPSADDNVEVSGLESESGKKLNGQRGVVVGYAEETGRFQVRFDGDKVVALKAENLGAWKVV